MYGSQKIQYKALSRRVLVVAVMGEVDDWAAYIDAVQGRSHIKEYKRVAEVGTKIPYWMAKTLFPNFDRKFKWRD